MSSLLPLLLRLALLPNLTTLPAETTGAELVRRVDKLEQEAWLLNRKLTLNSLVSIQTSPFVPRSAPPLGTLGQPMIIHLWSVHCPPCLKEMPELANLFMGLKSATPIRVVMLTEDSLDALETYLSGPHARLPAAELYAVGVSSHLRVAIQQAPLPTTFLVDGHLVIRQAFVGPLINRRNELLSAVERLCTSMNATCQKPQ